MSYPRYRMTRSSSQQESGFTLLECCVVVAIIIITTCFALPIVSSTLANAKVSSAVTSISGAIQVARYKALSKGVPYRITFDKSAGAYTVLACSNCAATIYAPTSTFTYDKDSSDPLTGVAIPFSSGSTGAVLDANRAIYLMPSGAVQWCADSTAACASPSTSCSTNVVMTLSYRGVSKTLTVACYGNLTASQ